MPKSKPPKANYMWVPKRPDEYADPEKRVLETYIVYGNPYLPTTAQVRDTLADYPDLRLKSVEGKWVTRWRREPRETFDRDIIFVTVPQKGIMSSRAKGRDRQLRNMFLEEILAKSPTERPENPPVRRFGSRLDKD